MTLARLKILNDENNLDSLRRDYSGMSDDAFTASMNTLNRPAPVPRIEMLDFLISQDTYADISDAAEDVAAVGHRESLNLMASLTIGEESPPMNLETASVVAMFNGLVTFTILTRAESDAITSLKDNRQSRAKELGIGVVRNRDLGRMRTEAAKGLI